MSSLLPIIRGYRITEKASSLNSNLNKYVFEVAPNANRIEVARAVAEQFKAKVSRVNILNHPGKRRSGRATGQRPGRTNSRKVAIVTLRAGERIEIA